VNIRDKSTDELESIASDIRNKILDTVSKNGGHLSSSMGATDLIVGMHHVFDPDSDPFLFDVSHQAYAHKLLTDRWDSFDTLRQFDGTCGYTDPKESSSDYYKAGHSSTSISLAVGAAKAIALKGEDRVPVAFIGDGSMTAGMVYEALNELGDRKYPVVIVLNDNEMSIAKPIGAISRYLSTTMASPFYQKFKTRVKSVMENFPDSTKYMAKKLEESFHMITPGLFFEELGIEYIGPIDGHDMESIVKTLEVARNMGRPVIIHAQTTKGKGYEIAEGTQEKWHGVGAFSIASGEPLKKSGVVQATKIYGDTLLEMAKRDKKIVGVTAAMPGGTGLTQLLEELPDRFWDVAIAEQHAVTSMGPLAIEGFKPFCTIYSTFLQRGYDQIIHDIALMNLGVKFAIDRAGIVGEDGETHQGVFDISFLRPIPNMTICAPYNKTSMEKIMKFVVDFPTPIAFRYPRGVFSTKDCDVPEYKLGKSHLLNEGKDVLFLGYGNGVGRALRTAELSEIDPAILDLRFVKPLDRDMLVKLSGNYKKWFVFSDSVKMGGVGSAILELLAEEKIIDIELTTFEYDDAFITHGNTLLVEESLQLLPEQLVKRVQERI